MAGNLKDAGRVSAAAAAAAKLAECARKLPADVIAELSGATPEGRQRQQEWLEWRRLRLNIQGVFVSSSRDTLDDDLIALENLPQDAKDKVAKEYEQRQAAVRKKRTLRKAPERKKKAPRKAPKQKGAADAGICLKWGARKKRSCCC